ncbi:beta-glucosidase 11-like isoform X2 [Rhododendron vialii]|uniref:beta-glucosidase 11-like isoform X2 n=1 Tax=Rhododendron vialii TaxID=182163 RepID=UPI00266042EF|nr:beta-glucosidase 11-like isoform X2 [Rhododendron vialii]
MVALSSFPLVSLVLIYLSAPGAILVLCAEEFSRNDFPLDFVFGSGTSAYQVEGAAFEDGRTPSIWDTFAHDGNVHGDTGDIACDGYHKYKEDVQLMVETGLEAYRFSIAWSRLIPYGRGPVNPKGLEYYSNFINELIRNGIQPHVTLVHSDLPQALEDEYGGWISRKVVKDFTAYADVCFREFGDRILHWSTFNEANIFVLGGYDVGFTPPNRCSPPFGVANCSKGNSSSEPYIAAHNILLAHASAASLYKNKYQGKQKGLIGINIFAYWLVPCTNATEDVIATQRANDFFIGWFVNPLVFGDYPNIVRKNAGTRIPAFTNLESQQVKGSFDFLGLNHYATLYIKDNPNKLNLDIRDFNADMAVDMISVHGDTPPDQFPIAPSGLVGVLEYFKQVYGNPPIYIHENGQQTRRNSTLDDMPRVNYLRGFIGGLLDALRNGSNARGYFTWSFLDVFELLDGYNSAFGLYYVDFDDKDLKRYPKRSAHWYSNFLKGMRIGPDAVFEAETISSLSQSHSSQ